MVLLKGQEHGVGRPQCQKKGSFQVGRGRLSDRALDSNLIETLCVACGILGLRHDAKNPQNVKGFFFFPPSLPLRLSLSLCLPSFSPVLPPYVQESLTSARRAALEAHWRIELEKRYRQREGEGLPLWHPAIWTLSGIALTHLWTNDLKGLNISEVSHPPLSYSFCYSGCFLLSPVKESGPCFQKLRRVS